MYYELAFIISPTVAETDQARLTKMVTDYLETIGGKIVGDIHPLGRRKLAYPIKKQKHGFYMFLDFSLEENKSDLRQLDTNLKHNPEILRHLILKKDKPTDPSLVAKLMAASKPEAAVRRPRKTMARTASSRPKSESATKTAPVKDKTLLSLDDIDKKLDEILTQEPKLD